MQYFKDHIKGADLLIWELTETVDALFALLPYIPVYVSEFQQLKSEKRKLEFLAARVAFHTLVGNADFIVYDSVGKPECRQKSFQISISHTKKWVAVVIHPTRKVGIDIEASTPKFTKLYSRFLNENEQNYLFKEEDVSKVAIAWCAKETLYKIIGIQAVDFKKQLEVNDFRLNNSGEITAKHNVTGSLYCLNYIQFNDFNLVYCVQ